jgi:hypothetical protein
MRISEQGDRVVVANTPVGRWLFGLAFVASGTLVLVMLATATGGSPLPWWGRAVTLLLGLSHLAAGLWFVHHHPAVRAEFDHARGTGRHQLRTPGRAAATVTEFPLAAVRAVEVGRSTDGDGDPMFQLRLWLAPHRVLVLQGRPQHGEAQAGARAARLRQLLRLPTPPGGAGA